MVLDVEATLFCNRALVLLDDLIEELFDVTALHANDVVVVLTVVKLEHRVPALEVMPDYQTRRLELSEHPVYGGETDILTRLQQRLVNILRAHVTFLAALQDGQDANPRQGCFEAGAFELLVFYHSCLAEQFVGSAMSAVSTTTSSYRMALMPPATQARGGRMSGGYATRSARVLESVSVSTRFALPRTPTAYLLFWTQVIVVSLYLACVFLYLRMTRQITPHPALQSSFRRYLLLAARRSVNRLLGRGRRGELRDIKPDQDRAFVASIPVRCVSDAEVVDASRIRLLEDGKPLGPAHASHEDVRRLGAGCYSHWFDHVFFSTSDGSDPRTNGRSYTFTERSK